MTIVSDYSLAALIQTLEVVSMRMWPALVTHYYGGWVLRFASGYTGRANAVHPLEDCALDLHDRIDQVEVIYRKRGLPVRFKLTPVSQPASLDAALEARGYERSYEVSVLTAALGAAPVERSPLVQISSRVTDEWLWHFFNISGTDMRNQHIVRQMLGNIIPQTAYAMLEKEGNVIALGIGVVEDDLLGLFKIETSARFRRQGYGHTLVSALLDWGKSRGATTAYLQTEPENIPALNLYARFGFEERYRYWYRILSAQE